MTIAKLAETYELEREGQRRFWIKQDPNNSCYASFEGSTGHTLCRKPYECLFCCAKYTEEKDLQEGLSARYTVAALKLFAKRQSWDMLPTLPTDKIFDFIYALDQRLTGAADLKKELSYYGALRCIPQELAEALDKKTLLSYYVEVAHKLGVAYLSPCHNGPDESSLRRLVCHHRR